mmetsp:Transcript_26071/g.82453  ORF Transcript_26071/g.82453 Transcript_26071/m.82453 type:complete len:294 (-) Transcript_26071:226-1107(-)
MLRKKLACHVFQAAGRAGSHHCWVPVEIIVVYAAIIIILDNDGRVREANRPDLSLAREDTAAAGHEGLPHVGYRAEVLDARVHGQPDHPVLRQLRHKVGAEGVALQAVHPHPCSFKEQVQRPLRRLHEAHLEPRGRPVALGDTAEDPPEVNATSTGTLAPVVEQLDVWVTRDLDIVDCQYPAVSAGERLGEQPVIRQQHQAVCTVRKAADDDEVLVVEALIVKAHSLRFAGELHLLVPPLAHETAQRRLARPLSVLAKHLTRLEEAPEPGLRLWRRDALPVHGYSGLGKDLEV